DRQVAARLGKYQGNGAEGQASAYPAQHDKHEVDDGPARGHAPGRVPPGPRRRLVPWPKHDSRRRILVEIDIGIGKSGRQAYGLDDIAIVPSRRTRDPDDVDISWQLDGFRFELPMMGSAMDGAI